MSLAVGDEHAALAATARRFLETNCPRDVARSGLDSPSDALPAFWPELASLGWLGLHLDPQYGGQGFGLSELAVVVEEMGRAGAPGPFLATVAAAAVISSGGSEAARKEWLPALADGSQIGAIAFPGCEPLRAARSGPDGSIAVTGRLRPVLSASLADLVVVPTRLDDTDLWCVLPADGLAVEELPSLDPTRRVASVTADEVPVPPAGQLAVPGGRVAVLIAALVAAECAGGAGWCVDTAAEYAKVRRQFGRAIGQFQAVKHRCAGMLLAAEQVRAAAWDAAAAVDDDGPRDSGGTSPSTELAGAVAAATAPALYLQVAEDCIQVLGGIGFTWEHDAHRYLRRAASLAALTGPSRSWRRRVATQALSGTRRAPGPASDLVAGHDGFRQEIRSEVDRIAALPKDERRRALVEAGLLVPHWPRPWGREAAAAEQLIIDEELRRAALVRPNLAVGAWAAPTIAAHGTAEQQERWVGPTLRGEIRWCQLFSEPGAGSDLASLTTRAVRAEGGWSLTGQKVWTSMAADADFGICLARTDPAAPKHAGITYFVVDMGRAGIDIRPLREMTGHAMFNEVFLDDVFVPDDHVVGNVNGGWALARTTLANERVAMGSGSSFGGGIEALLHLVEEMGAEHLDPVDLDHLGALLCESHCLSVMGTRATHRAVTSGGPGPESSVRKLLGVEHDQRTQEMGLSLLGGDGAATDGRGGQWSFGFLANRCLTIAGGTSEVQRNVIAERLLGLPRDPEPAG